ncbi:MAG: tetratricopeptide repeat protein [Acidobacteria bacterium]|nr:tetratricopeptide repeat protein [Acidobacteriota bacterium]
MRQVLIVVLAISALACASGEDMALLHREITDVQREIQGMRSNAPERQDLTSMENRMKELTEKNMRSNADLAMQVQKLQERMEGLHASLELTTRQLQQISQELAAARSRSTVALPPVTAMPNTDAEGRTGGPPTALAAGAAVGATAVASPGAEMSPDRLYRSAYEDYMRGNYDLAAQGFQDYRRRFPDTELSDNALYWVGECYAAQDLTDEAIQTFSQVLEDYPNSDKGAASQLKKGLLYLNSGDQGQGVVNLQYVVYEHPGTKEADLAREKLRSLGLNIR